MSYVMYCHPACWTCGLISWYCHYVVAALCVCEVGLLLCWLGTQDEGASDGWFLFGVEVTQRFTCHIVTWHFKLTLTPWCSLGGSPLWCCWSHDKTWLLALITKTWLLACLRSIWGPARCTCEVGSFTGSICRVGSLAISWTWTHILTQRFTCHMSHWFLARAWMHGGISGRERPRDDWH